MYLGEEQKSQGIHVTNNYNNYNNNNDTPCI